jgi:hypothetical protein
MANGLWPMVGLKADNPFSLHWLRGRLKVFSVYLNQYGCIFLSREERIAYR